MPMSTNSVAPGAHEARTGARPGVAAGGTSTASRSGEANTTRAATPPIEMALSRLAGAGKPAPRNHRRAPSITPRGSMPVSATAPAAMARSYPSGPNQPFVTIGA
jgi:hypothetical protein